MYTTDPELHLNVSALHRNVLLLEVSTPQGPVLHLNMSVLHRNVLLLEVSTPQGSVLHLNMSALQRPVLHLDISRVTPHGPEVHLDFLLQRPCAASRLVYT